MKTTKSSKTELIHDIALVVVVSVLATIAWSLTHLTSKKFRNGSWLSLVGAILAVMTCFALYYFDAMK